MRPLLGLGSEHHVAPVAADIGQMQALEDGVELLVRRHQHGSASGWAALTARVVR
jgi:hypothetical protein